MNADSPKTELVAAALDVAVLVIAVALLIGAAFLLPWYLFLAGALFIALGLTWYFADDEPVLAPASPARVTFKAVLQNFLRDVLDLTRPLINLAKRFWIWAAPKLTNPTTWAAIATIGATAWPHFANDPAGQALLARYPLLYFVGAGVALLATRPASAPYRVPANGYSPTGGLVNNQAIG
jgi:hypothetical protein